MVQSYCDGLIMRNPHAPVMKIIYEEDTALGKIKKAAEEARMAGKQIHKIMLPRAEYADLLAEFGGDKRKLEKLQELLGIKHIGSL